MTHNFSFQSPDHACEHAANLLQTGQIREAEAFYRAILQKAPDLGPATLGLAQALSRQGKIEEATLYFDQAIGFIPDNGDIRLELGTLLLDTGRTKDAQECFEQALEDGLEDARFYIGLALVKGRQKHIQEAYQHLLKALEIDPQNELAHYNILTLLDLMQDKDEIKALVDNARKAIPDSLALPLMESQLVRNNGDLDEAIAILENAQIPPGPLAVKKEFTLGHLYDKKDDPDTAFKHFTAANTLEAQSATAKNIDKTVYPKMIDHIMEQSDQDWALPWEPPAQDNVKTPVFLVGFPRSGTTLVGQILHTHPDIFVADEIPALGQSGIHMQTYDLHYPEGLSALNPEQIQELQEIYWDAQKTAPGWEESKLFIDKFPFNMVYGGLIKRLYPHAKIIHLQRHPNDCVLSCFMQNFQLNPALIHCLNLESAAQLYIQATECWDKQKMLCKLNVHTLRYEDLVNDFEKEARRLLDFVDVPWDDAVWAFHKKAQTETRTITPSHSQITQALYTDAQYRWKKYESHMGAVIDILKPIVEKAGY